MSATRKCMSGHQHAAKLLAVLCASLLLFLPVDGHAQQQDEPTPAELAGLLFDDMVDQFKDEIAKWHGPLQTFATRLLLLFFLVTVVWQGGQMAFGNGDLSEFFKTAIYQVLTFGFFLVLIRMAPQWVGMLVDGASRLPWHVAMELQLRGGDQITVPAGVGASQILGDGMNAVHQLVETGFSFSIGFVMICFAAMILVIIYAVLATFLIIAQIEGYMIAAIGILCLGLGGNQWTNAVAQRYIWFVVGFAVKVMALYIIVGLGNMWIQTNLLVVVESAKEQNQLVGAGAMCVAMALMLGYVAYAIPVQLERLFAGSASSSSEVMRMMMQSATTISMGAMAAMGTGLLSGGANVGKAMGAAAQALPGSPGIGQALRHNPGELLGGTFGNLGNAMKQNMFTARPGTIGATLDNMAKQQNEAGSSG